MARKNGNGEGSRPRQRADGRWEAKYWDGVKRRSVYASTRKEAADKLAKAIANNEGPHATFVPTNITVQEYFAQYDVAVRDTMKRRSLETLPRHRAVASAPSVREQEAQSSNPPTGSGYVLAQAGCRSIRSEGKADSWRVVVCPQSRGTVGTD